MDPLESLGVRRRRRILGLPIGPKQTDWTRVGAAGAGAVGALTTAGLLARRGIQHAHENGQGDTGSSREREGSERRQGGKRSGDRERQGGKRSESRERSSSSSKGQTRKRASKDDGGSSRSGGSQQQGAERGRKRKAAASAERSERRQGASS
jgi:hypothetical protein